MPSKPLWLTASLLALLLCSGCATTRIGLIQSDPSRYRNKQVAVNGTVTTSFGLLSTGAYEIQDDSGKIYVLSRTGVPAKGSRVTVHGTVVNGIMLGGNALGTAIREQSHKVR